MRPILLAVLLLSCSGCPPQPKPTPVPAPTRTDLAAPNLNGDACDLTLDMGVPEPCAGLFVKHGLQHQDQPCARCPVPSACWWNVAAIRCVPFCVQDDVCGAQ